MTAAELPKQSPLPKVMNSLQALYVWDTVVIEMRLKFSDHFRSEKPRYTGVCVPVYDIPKITNSAVSCAAGTIFYSTVPIKKTLCSCLSVIPTPKSTPFLRSHWHSVEEWAVGIGCLECSANSWEVWFHRLPGPVRVLRPGNRRHRRAPGL